MTSEEYIGKKGPRWYVVLLRLYMGGCFLYVGVNRFLAWRAGMQAEPKEHVVQKGVQRLLSMTQIDWFRTYLDRVIEPIKDSMVLTVLMLAAPLLLGLSLVLGFLTRLGAFLGVLLVLNAYLIRFFDGTPTQLMFLQLQIAVLVTLFLAAAGRTFGIDATFWRHRIRQKYEPRPPKEVKAAAKPVSATTVKREPVPLSSEKSGKVEHTEGFFPPPSRPAGRPATPTPKPEPKPEGGEKPTPGK